MDYTNHEVKTLLHLLDQPLEVTNTDRHLKQGGPKADIPRDVFLLHCLIAKGHVDRVNQLLAESDHMDIVNCLNPGGTTALQLAANTNHLDVLRILLENGAEVNRQRSIDKYTPLHIAVLSGMVDTARCLLASGANVNATNVFGNTALHLAAGLGRIELLEILLAAGAQFKEQNFSGKTPLADAVRNNQTLVVNRLLEAGANGNVLHNQNQSLLVVTMKDSLPYMSLQLVRYGASLPTINYIINWLRPNMLEQEMLVFLAFVLCGNGLCNSMDILQKVVMSRKRLPHALRTWVDKHAGSPLQLNLLCREKVRQLLLQTSPLAFGSSIYELPLPVHLIDFLLLSDLKFSNMTMRIVFRNEQIVTSNSMPYSSSPTELKLKLEIG